LGVLCDIWSPGTCRSESIVNFVAEDKQMTATQALTNADLNQAQPTKPPCPTWKKVTAGVLVVTAIALFVGMWLGSSASTESITGLAIILAVSLGLVVGGIAVVTALLWILSRSARAMSRGRAAVAYMVHCYPQQLKERILSH
jgi:uncharacterized membrane protein YcjF (UPF0283 family)